MGIIFNQEIKPTKTLSELLSECFYPWVFTFTGIFWCGIFTGWKKLVQQLPKSILLKKAMEKMKVEWKDMTFEFIAYRDSVSIKWQIIFNQTISCF